MVPLTPKAVDTSSTPTIEEQVVSEQPQKNTPLDVFVAGALASDTICDYQPLSTNVTEMAPVMHTSNPSQITQSPGGVGRNVAFAAHLAGAQVALASVVADDLAGKSLLKHVKGNGLSTDYIRQIPTSDGARTAQYVAVNDMKKDLVVAMADMAILGHPELESTRYWSESIAKSQAKWVVVDANWSPAILSSIIAAAKSQNAKIAFEPVSTAKAARLFHPATSAMTSSKVVPNHVINLASPNSMELSAIYHAARDALMFESEQWWKVIDSFGLSSSGSRDRLVAVAGSDLVDQGIPQQCMQLLPFIPNLVTKLGRKGCLMTSLLRRGDDKLTDPDYARYVIARTYSDDSEIGGVYMKLLPPSRLVDQSEVVSVNGIGDTMLGVVVAGLAKDFTLEDILPIAQDAAIFTLKSHEAVSPEVRGILDQK